MSKHTPRPWQIIKFPEAVIIACNPKIGQCATICELPLPSTDEEAEEIEANTRLMAAAPQLLEALEMADELIDQLIIDNTDNYAEERAKIRAALKAAKGEI